MQARTPSTAAPNHTDLHQMSPAACAALPSAPPHRHTLHMRGAPSALPSQHAGQYGSALLDTSWTCAAEVRHGSGGSSSSRAPAGSATRFACSPSVTLNLCSSLRAAMRSSVSSGSSALYGSPGIVSSAGHQWHCQPACMAWTSSHAAAPKRAAGERGANNALAPPQPHTSEQALLVGHLSLRHCGPRAGLVARRDHAGLQ